MSEPGRDMSHPPLHAATVVKDPVCGMDVIPGQARGGSAEHDGATYWFCNPGCREKFGADPGRYLVAPSATPAPAVHRSGTIHTCPMHPEIRQPGPGSCPKDGMALEPVSAPAALTREEWTCPMHPEIVRPGPGTCPICGM